jgi:RHS repeat-associated protein
VLRVKKCVPNCTSPTTTTIYVFSGSKVVAEYENGAAVNAPTREYIYLGSQLLAKDEGGTLTYYHQDHLSNRVMTNTSGDIAAQSGHFPFGENWYETSANKLKFTSYERDAESGNDYAIFRMHINRFGRFSSPDRLSGSVSAPQSLNRFSYSLNDPINLSDPLGLVATAFTCTTGYEAACSASGSESTVYYYNGFLLDSRTAQSMGGSRLVLALAGITVSRVQDGYFPHSDIPLYDYWINISFIYLPPQSLSPQGGDSYREKRELIERVRQVVLDILMSPNECSDFFNSSDQIFEDNYADYFDYGEPIWGPLAADRLASQDIRLDATPGLNPGIGMRTSGGRWGPIFVPVNGAFFYNTGPVGGSASNSLRGQVIQMLHDFAHKLDLIPDDRPGDGSSQRNTEKILKHCSKQFSLLP